MTNHAGFVAIIGKPNVGKSTLLNSLIGQKISITSRKPQTTRQNITGVRTEEKCQILFVDTPGIHTTKSRALNRYMNRSARLALKDVDVVLLVLDRDRFGKEDEYVSEVFLQNNAKKIVVVNKIDLYEDSIKLLPFLADLQNKYPDAALIPLSAKKEKNLDTLLKVVKNCLPIAPFYFPDDQLTDRSERFLVSEIIREKIMRQFGREIPHQTVVALERMKIEKEIVNIDATVFVEKNSQKRILIGSSGDKIKRVSTDARLDIENLLEKKVMLRTWVKVKSGWSRDDDILKSLGFNEI
ncbi:MAG: GTPase Era [Gammaproteobacteria bacterium]|nr:GTPase Era [Gammaproteobacteria bacterium]